VLLAMRNVPSMVWRMGKDKFVREVQLTMDKEDPTNVKFLAEMVLSVVVKKPKLLVTLARASMLMDWMLRKEAFATVKRVGKLTVS
jgi:hypothetical protein